MREFRIEDDDVVNSHNNSLVTCSHDSIQENDWLSQVN